MDLYIVITIPSSYEDGTRWRIFADHDLANYTYLLERREARQERSDVALYRCELRDGEYVIGELLAENSEDFEEGP